MNGDLDPAWERITAWLRLHSPVTAATLRPPAPAEEVRATQNAIGKPPLPAELLRWWGLTDGVDDDRDHRTALNFPEGHMPLSVARVREEWADLSRFPDEDCCRPGGHHLRSAGDITFGYCTALTPICRGIDGAVLAVDLRPGTERGRLMDWMAEQGTLRATWATIGEMLTDTARRLDQYTASEIPPRPGAPTIRDDGALMWA
ncbi:SMI1/KNR4 family protein [Amycolatopsis speibonae]|uniref:SMI1/KNR4 family protein n=1 Tax=Amycolatopsis speibonae TaxID=1450224 RepID=A0ABV7NS99_9PSEU